MGVAKYRMLIISWIIINMDTRWISLIIKAVCHMDKVINKDSKMDANEECVLPNTRC